jgi:oligogalacturonide lyase
VSFLDFRGIPQRRSRETPMPLMRFDTHSGYSDRSHPSIYNHVIYNRIMRVPMGQVSLAMCSRRRFLASLACSASAMVAAQDVSTKQPRERAPAETRHVRPSVAVRYLDPATEFVVVRLTDPQFHAVLPSGGTRPLSNRAMLYASDATGKWEALRMDLRTHESLQLTDAAALDPQSPSFQPGEKGFWHFDGGRLIETIFSGNKTREVYRTPEDFEKTPGVAYSYNGRSGSAYTGDGQWAVFVEKGGSGERLRLVDLMRGTSKTLVETAGVEDAEEIRDALVRPKHAAASYRIGTSIWTVDFGNGEKQRLALAEGEVLQCQWTADGRTLLYLHRPPEPKKLTAVRAFVPENQNDTWLADTSQFVRFSANADASVFAGASGSKASPYVLLLARAVKREFTLAEHKASDPRMVAPMFTPNSQSLVFQSDRHGKPAIYWMAVEKFVSETEGS